MATIYSPTAQSLYFKKSAGITAAQGAAAPAATPFGSSSFNMYPQGQAAGGALGSSPFAGGNMGGATIYSPTAQAPVAPSLNSQRPSFMGMSELQPRVTSVTSLAGAGGAAAGGVAGAAGQAPTQPADYSNITALLQKQMQAANAANESRYNQLLGLADQQGQSQMQASQRVRVQELGNSQASLVNRGLGNSTIVDSARRGIINDAQGRQQTIANNVAANKSGIIERRTDAAPDLSLYAQLLSQPGGAGMAEALLKATGKTSTKKK